MRTPLRLAVALVCAALLAVGAAGCGDDDDTPPAADTSPTQTGGATTGTTPSEPVTVYFSDETGRLVAEERVGTASLEGALALLAEGPESADLVAALPTGTRVLGATVEDGAAEVDLSAEFESGYPPGGAAAELAIVGPIVGTAAAQPGVESVLITVEGRVPAPVGTQFDFSQPFSPEDFPVDESP
jgi:spore germination protein GerM